MVGLRPLSVSACPAWQYVQELGPEDHWYQMHHVPGVRLKRCHVCMIVALGQSVGARLISDR